MVKCDSEQLVSAKTAADLKGFNSLELFLYHAKLPGAPEPVVIDGCRFWDKQELAKWTPKTKGTRNQPKETTDAQEIR